MWAQGQCRTGMWGQGQSGRACGDRGNSRTCMWGQRQLGRACGDRGNSRTGMWGQDQSGRACGDRGNSRTGMWGQGQSGRAYGDRGNSRTGMWGQGQLGRACADRGNSRTGMWGQGQLGRACGDRGKSRTGMWGQGQSGRAYGDGGIARRACGDKANQDGQGTMQGLSGILESTAQNDFEHEGWTQGGKRKRPMCAGVVFGDIEKRMSDILPDPSPLPSDVSESRKKFIKGLCTFRGGVSPQVVEAMKMFYNIQDNVSRKYVDLKLNFRFSEKLDISWKKDITTMYNKIKVLSTTTLNDWSTSEL